MNRNQGGSSWIVKAAAYVGATTLAAGTVGALLGLAGSQVQVDARGALATLFAIASVALGAAELGGRRVPVIQRDKETPQGWIHAGAVRWALVNGATLGIGATSRLGFWLWYAIPIGSFLGGSVVLGAAIYGAYGLLRGAGAVMLLLVATGRARSINDVALELIGRRAAMQRLAAAQLALVGLLVAAGAGIYGL